MTDEGVQVVGWLVGRASEMGMAHIHVAIGTVQWMQQLQLALSTSVFWAV